MTGPLDVVVALASTASAIAAASKLAPEVQLVRATSRAERRRQRVGPRRFRRVVAAAEQLRAAHEAGDREGMIAALLVLQELDVTADDVKSATHLAELLLEGPTEDDG